MEQRSGLGEKWREDQGLNRMLPGGNDAMASASRQVGPAAPTTVVTASKRALSLLGDGGASSLKTEPHQLKPEDASPLVHANAALLERTPSGTVRVPPIVEGIGESSDGNAIVQAWSEGISQASNGSFPAQGSPQLDPVQKQRNLHWLRNHFRALHEIARLPFNNADLWQLHQYFFSPLVEVQDREAATPLETNTPPGTSFDMEAESANHAEAANGARQSQATPPSSGSSPPPPSGASNSTGLGRSVSFQFLSGSVHALASPTVSAEESGVGRRRSQRRSLEMMSGDSDDSTSESEEGQPAAKKAKNFKPRIAHYPRIRGVLETLGSKASQHQTLSILRQLKFVESTMFQGKNVYDNSESIRDSNQPTPSDVEMILLDLL
eukprot:CAMPEP_0116825340 /NCGR_PEP_ID=MMETSP0418-20121206/1909_1 /TAXON_ID=1158023 /ORGANISM="Astrosyne radiata, Strain 13vi08-1A" /LENGTH=379 /DNA_ID=CAMNT_0004453833 /DNA_START=210 /DNA_END=1352 /DNA_ORIENTATION=-